MKRLALVLSLAVLPLLGGPARTQVKDEDSLDRLRAVFEQHSGATLVFDAKDLPAGSYHDRMDPLAEAGRKQAARIAVSEVRKLPPGYLGKIGLKAVGVFAACVSEKGDGFRPYDEKLKGYRYYGIWNGKDGVAAAYYTDGQLPLTLHHEVFHHVDATLRGKTDYDANFAKDERFKDVTAGKAPYAAPKIAADDLAALKKLSKGRVLETVVSDYCKKSPGEDKAETARYLMSALPDALVQVATRPELPGSQRILHVLRKYEEAVPNGPGVGWFVDVALGRAEVPDNPYLKNVDAAVEDAKVRAAIRAVQPACVALGGGSGVNLAPEGLVLTAGHVAKKPGAELTVLFPDGRKYKGTCVALDDKLDVAVVRLDTKDRLPFAPLAKAPPVKGTRVVCVGQPSDTRPDGKPSGYKPFHVSAGAIRGFLDDPLGDQVPLGRTKHDAWTYWGHSGGPLFDEAGRIVAMHSSWDSTTAMRHAVTHEAIVHVLKREKIGFTIGD